MQILDTHPLAPSDEGAVSAADWGRESPGFPETVSISSPLPPRLPLEGGVTRRESENRLDTMREQVGRDVFSIAENDRLSESYRERDRRLSRQ